MDKYNTTISKLWEIIDHLAYTDRINTEEYRILGNICKAIFDVKEEHRLRRDCIDALRSCVIVEEKEEEEEDDDDNEDDEVDDEEVVGRLKSAYYDDVNDYDNDDMDSNRAASF
jgi:hypothetical protein